MKGDVAPEAARRDDNRGSPAVERGGRHPCGTLFHAGARAHLTKPLDIPAVFRGLDDVLAPPA
jgi:hypothetical protein